MQITDAWYYSPADDGTLTFQQAIETGVQPDMVTFTPDGSKILTANEGEPREGYTATDPQGSVTVIEVKTLQAQTIGFETYDTAEARQALTNAGVLLKKETNPSVVLSRSTLPLQIQWPM